MGTSWNEAERGLGGSRTTLLTATLIPAPALWQVVT